MNNLIYIILNIVVLIITACIFVFNYKDAVLIFQNETFLLLLLLVCTVILVYIAKAVRLYLALYGNKIKFIEFLKIYCKVTPVSIILPFKIGEIYRIYCYGRQIRNYLRTAIIILLDRFMDTIALLSVMFIIYFFHRNVISKFMYLLILFLLFCSFLYIIFPKIYIFWKLYLLSAKASPNKIFGLSILKKFNKIYIEIEGIIKGKGILLYLLSVIAWAMEIGNVLIIKYFTLKNIKSLFIFDYLNSAFSGNKTTEFKQFIFVSVFILIFIYFYLLIFKKRYPNENSSRL